MATKFKHLKKINVTQYYYRNTCQLIVIRHTLRAIIQIEVDLIIEHLIIKLIGEGERMRYFARDSS